MALADLNADVRAERHLGLDVDHDADEALEAAAELVDEVLAEADMGRDALLGVGLGLPGPIDADTGPSARRSSSRAGAGATPATSSRRGWACRSPSTTTRTSARWPR